MEKFLKNIEHFPFYKASFLSNVLQNWQIHAKFAHLLHDGCRLRLTNPSTTRSENHYIDITGRRCVSNHRQLDCVFSSLYRLITRNHQSSAFLVRSWGIHRSPLVSTHKGPVIQNGLQSHNVIMDQSRPKIEKWTPNLTWSLNTLRSKT